jgi:CBS domain-containing protein
MYDVLDDELKRMGEVESEVKDQLAKAFMLKEPISQLPKQPFYVVTETEPLINIIEQFKKHHVNCVLIERNDKLVGIFSEKDIIYHIVGNQLDLSKEIVGDYMTKSPQKLRPSDPLAYALNRMVDGGFRHVPLINSKHKPVGVVSLCHIINCLGKHYNEEIMNLPHRPLRSQTQREGG